VTHATSAIQHPSRREIRAGFLADPGERQTYRSLEPRVEVVRQLIELCEKHGRSQRDLAERAGMKQFQLARLETG
jgi:hypothetical protein